MFFILSVVLLMANIGLGSAQDCLQPEKIKVMIYDDELCEDVNEDETAANVLSQEDIDHFNDCHDL